MIDAQVLDELKASVAGDLAFVRDLVDTYVADSAGQVDAIEAAVTASDADALVRPAHTLKSSSATVGAVQLSATARTLEMAGRSGTLAGEDAGRAASVLRGEWEATTSALRAWVDGASE
ncbi:MAG TPA: Hpt domain-containing protein [Candidatus Limnocylindria bacterium]